MKITHSGETPKIAAHPCWFLFFLFNSTARVVGGRRSLTSGPDRLVWVFFCFKGARSSCTQNERERTATTPKTYARKHSARKTLAECCNGHSPPQLPDPLSNKRPERDRRLEEREIRVRENQCLTVWLLLL